MGSRPKSLSTEKTRSVLSRQIKTGPYTGLLASEKFWSFVNISSDKDCWKWSGLLFGNNYGRFNVFGLDLLAHRISYILNVDSIPKNMLICHHCDNKICVNPRHLFVGTYKQNIKDMNEKGRGNPSRGEACGRSKLMNEDIFRIRHLWATDNYLQKELACKFGISSKQISIIVNRKQWAHLPELV